MGIFSVSRIPRTCVYETVRGKEKNVLVVSTHPEIFHIRLTLRSGLRESRKLEFLHLPKFSETLQATSAVDWGQDALADATITGCCWRDNMRIDRTGYL